MCSHGNTIGTRTGWELEPIEPKPLEQELLKKHFQLDRTLAFLNLTWIVDLQDRGDLQNWIVIVDVQDEKKDPNPCARTRVFIKSIGGGVMQIGCRG